MKQTVPRLLKAYLALVLVVMALPLVSVMALSLNRSSYGTLPFSFSLRWYEALAANTSLVQALVTSLNLAGQAMLFATIVGTLLSLALVRSGRFVNVPVNALLLTLMTVPSLVLAAGFVIVFDRIGLGSSSTSLVLASVVTSLPFVVLIVSGRLRTLDPNLAQAARSLGAGPLRVFATVTVPLVGPAIVAGAVLAFLTTFNNFAIQLFLSPIGISTLPVQIYSMVRLGVKPDVNALATFVILATVALVVVVTWLSGNAARFLSTSTQNSEDHDG
ncbi:ABC transporter permease [Kineococcus rhizosphaerae]|uniref:Spermidine/putrescine transport system permease protein n=1 Tax=Kineococcus rhizosphaerae TaxID=559628 RepID=A0A2T0R222_9ACTN|nr:ABC transporter permease [Kineococcus rhizosphaerae]PRY13612.1 spermidine/putrescine transport system permease protein [Kineococcus rhizosphaerae]